MINKQTVIQLAISQIGYHEKATNADLDDPVKNSGDQNWTKFARDLDAIEGFYNGKKNGPWGEYCDMLIDWLFIKSYGLTVGMKLLCQPWGSAGAGCQYSAQYYEKQGRFFASDPEPGDQIFFDYGGGINHTGLVIDVNDYAIITVEGNVDNQVKRCSYPHSSTVIAGYGRPDWSMDGEPDVPEPDEPAPETCEVTATLPIIKYDDTGLWVKVMQVLLIGKGFSCGQYGADGEYGMQTKIGLYQFQKANNLETDCVCDEQTWSLLLR